MEIITGVERRRPWSLEEKLRLVAECDAPGSSVTRVARQYEVSPALLWSWRRQLRRGSLGGASQAAEFLPVTMMPPPSGTTGAAESDMPSLEIVLPDGIMVRIPRGVDTALVERVLGILRR